MSRSEIPMECRSYTVKQGDTLWDLARKHRVLLSRMLEVNHLSHDSVIQPGQGLCLPTAAILKPSQAVGRPQQGRLINGQRLGTLPGAVIKRPLRSYAINELISLLTRCQTDTARRHHGDSPLLVVGDLSAKEGGKLPGHASHQSGLDLDLGYAYQEGTEVPQDRFLDKPARIDLQATWKLLSCLLSSGEVNAVFIDGGIRQRLIRHACKHQRCSRPRLRYLLTVLVSHPNHGDHYHVRLLCPVSDISSDRDVPGCVDNKRRRAWVQACQQQ